MKPSGRDEFWISSRLCGIITIVTIIMLLVNMMVVVVMTTIIMVVMMMVVKIRTVLYVPFMSTMMMIMMSMAPISKTVFLKPTQRAAVSERIIWQKEKVGVLFVKILVQICWVLDMLENIPNIQIFQIFEIFRLAALSCGKSAGQGCSTMVSIGAGGQQRNPSHTAGQHGQHPGGEGGG